MRPHGKLGLKIKEARTSRGFSQKALAQKTGTSRRQVIKWENGEHRPSPHYRKQLERVLEFPKGSFDGEDDEDVEALNSRVDGMLVTRGLEA